MLIGFTGPEQPPQTTFQPPELHRSPGPDAQADVLAGLKWSSWAVGRGGGEEKRLVRDIEVCGCLQCPNNINFIA